MPAIGLRGWWRWWRALSDNPIYRREMGAWGKPNRHFDNVMRFSPFLVLGALLIGACTGFGNPGLLRGDSTLNVLWCLLCLPGILVSALTLFGSFMAPALTAPSISAEISQGTWDLLRLTPHATESLVLAKLFGALARLRIWRILLVLCLLQAAMIAGTFLLVGDTSPARWLQMFVVMLATAGRPWLEIAFAAFLGMYVSTWVRSATLALAASYGGLLLVRVLSSGVLWAVLLSLFMPAAEPLIALSLGLGPLGVYATGAVALWFGLLHRAQNMG